MAAAAPTTEFVVLNGVKRCLHIWNQPQSNTAQDNHGLVAIIIYHGFLAHGLYPTVRYAAELLSSTTNNDMIAGSSSDDRCSGDRRAMVVVAADIRGHGQSDGVPGYLESSEQCIADALAVAKNVVETYRPSQVLLLGSSMGGTIALHVANQWDHHMMQTMNNAKLKGVILLAPMLKLKVSWLEESVLYALTCMMPNTMPLIPSSKNMDGSKQYRDEKKRRECEDDPHVAAVTACTGGKLRLASAYTCIRLVKDVITAPQPVLLNVPVLLMVADQDVVVDSQGSLDYYDRAMTASSSSSGGGDKLCRTTLKRYPALHGLLCEPKPLVDTIQKDLLSWINENLD